MEKGEQKIMTTEEVNEFIIGNQHLSNVLLAKATGLSSDAIQKRWTRLGLPLRKTQKTIVVKKSKVFHTEVFNSLKDSKEDLTIEDLTNVFDCSAQRIREALELLAKEGKNIRIAGNGFSVGTDIPKAAPTVIDSQHTVGKTIRFGFVSDNHLCSRYERLDVLNALYDIYKKEGITTVYNGGNMIDGEANFNKFDIHTYGLEGQVDYLVQKYPQRDGIKTLFITGDDHEGWYVQREGINIGQTMQSRAREAGREDLVYLGHMEHDIVLKTKKGQSVIRLIHAGGGSSYATSYTAQKITESYQGGEKPQVLVIGHYHKAEYGFPWEVHCVQGGCTEDQTPFMRKKRLSAHVGGWIIELTQAENGTIIRFKAEWIPFFDRGFYDKNWKYQWNKK